MIALDTNVLARLLLRDDEAQFQRVMAYLSQPQVFTAPPTVFLELVWVLESYQLTRLDIAQALRGLLGLPNFRPQAEEALCDALSGYAQGMDFGDALHLALSQNAKRFATFDKSMGKLATQHGLAPTVEVLHGRVKQKGET